jgi:hypothetical protein
MTLLGRHRLPEEARAVALTAAPLGEHERVLEWAATGSGGWCIATTIGLRCPDGYELLRWDEVRHVTYRDGVMDVEPVDSLSLRFRLDEAHHLPEIVRDRVSASIPYDRHVRLTSDGLGMRILARRRPDTEEMTWHPTYDDGLDLHDPTIRARAQAAMDEARSLFG